MGDEEIKIILIATGFEKREVNLTKSKSEDLQRLRKEENLDTPTFLRTPSLSLMGAHPKTEKWDVQKLARRR
jgi:hypothetical protein